MRSNDTLSGHRAPALFETYILILEFVDLDPEVVALGCGISALEEVQLHVADAQPAHREGKTWSGDVLRWYRLFIRVLERAPRGHQHGAHERLHAVKLGGVAQTGKPSARACPLAVTRGPHNLAMFKEKPLR